MPRRRNVSKKELREDEKGRGKGKKKCAERGCTRIREEEREKERGEELNGSNIGTL